MKEFFLTIGIAAMTFLAPQYMFAQQSVEAATDSINTILNKAKNGDADAQNEVGAWYYKGKHVKQNYEEAAQWWARSAKQGNLKAIGNLGLCYQTGNGVRKDSITAVKLYERSVKQGNQTLFNQNEKLADSGNMFACMFMAHCYRNGIGTAKDLNKAAGFYGKAAQQNNVDAQRELALLYLNAHKDEEAVKWFEKAAENGDLSSTYYYGKLLYEGKGVKQDEQHGMNYLLKTAEAGFPMGQYMVAQAYFDGKGVMKNMEQGAEWMIKAANNGVIKAQYELAMCYIDGKGVNTDYSMATSWLAAYMQKAGSAALRKAFDEGGKLNGTPFHAYLKGLRYYDNKDFDNALKQFQTVEKEDKIDGETMKGIILANKDYKKYNIKKGVKTLTSAAKTSPMAMYILGCMYETGKGVEKDAAKAVTLLENAAKLHYAPALCYLGDMYYEGREVTQDYAKAANYYNQALELLTQSAAKRLASCYENGWGGLEKDNEKAKEIMEKQPVNTQSLLKLVPMN